MDNNLLLAVTRAIAGRAGVELLSPEQAESLRARVRDVFGFDEDMIWWWQQDATNRTSVEYKAEDGLPMMLSVLSRPEGERLSLFITDDDPPPWICLQGRGQNLVDVLTELHWVEYFVVDEALKKVVFDTHHSELVSYQVGNLREAEHGATANGPSDPAV